MAYLNANATTPMYKNAIRVMADMYSKPINVHSDDAMALQIAGEIQAFADTLTAAFAFRPLFVSGASEANSMAIRSFATQYPTGCIVTTRVEHSGTIQCIINTGLPVVYMKPHTNNTYNEMCCFSDILPTGPLMFCIIHGNNETGYINDVCAMARLIKIIHQAAIVHVDAVQTFCKQYRSADMFDAGVDSVTASFHKVRGPHLGLLLHRDPTYLRPLVFGSQQAGLRGGTLPAPLIIAAQYAYAKNIRDCQAATVALSTTRSAILAALSRMIPVVDVLKACISTDICICQTKKGRHLDLFAEPHIQVFGLDGQTSLPNTIFMIVYDPSGRFCNVECKKHLYTHGIIIGIGSACMTSKTSASHIADAYNLNKLQKRGLLRLSFLPKLPMAATIFAITKLGDYIATTLRIRRLDTVATPT